MGIIGTTKEHLSLALSLQVPVFIVVTKIDMCPPQVLEETMQNISRLIKSKENLQNKFYDILMSCFSAQTNILSFC